MNKLAKVRAEVEKLKSQLLRGACSSQVAMETRCKEEAYNEVLAILDSLQEESVKRAHADIEAAMQEVEDKSKAFTEAHKGESADDILAQMRGEESVSEELGEASKEWLKPQLDKSYANYGEGKMMELTRFDGYAMLDAIEFGANWQKQQDQSTIELAEDHAMLAGMEKMKEEMMAKAVDAELYSDGMLTPLISVNDKKKISDIKFGDKIKLIIIKDE